MDLVAAVSTGKLDLMLTAVVSTSLEIAELEAVAGSTVSVGDTWSSTFVDSCTCGGSCLTCSAARLDLLSPLFGSSRVYSSIILNPGDLTFFGRRGLQVNTPKRRLPRYISRTLHIFSKSRRFSGLSAWTVDLRLVKHV